jgi:hypothetical protein
MITITVAFIFLVIGFKWGAFVQKRAILDELKKLEGMAQSIAGVDEKTIQVKIEKIEDTFYLYDTKTDKFIAQGKSKEEIAEYLQKYYPDYVVLAEHESATRTNFK